MVNSHPIQQGLARVEAEVTAVKGNHLKIKFVTATPMVTAGGKVVFQASHWVDREDEVERASPKKKK